MTIPSKKQNFNVGILNQYLYFIRSSPSDAPANIIFDINSGSSFYHISDFHLYKYFNYFFELYIWSKMLHFSQNFPETPTQYAVTVEGSMCKVWTNSDLIWSLPWKTRKMKGTVSQRSKLSQKYLHWIAAVNRTRFLYRTVLMWTLQNFYNKIAEWSSSLIRRDLFMSEIHAIWKKWHLA